MSNDVVMVAIPKELRDAFLEICENNKGLAYANFASQLRAAPETLSLEGVDDRMWEKALTERDAAEDLIEQVAIHFGCTEEWSSMHSHFDCIREAMDQLPQPVAPQFFSPPDLGNQPVPVQDGGVDFNKQFEYDVYNIINKHCGNNPKSWSDTIARELHEMGYHLTTTQSTGQSGGVDQVEPTEARMEELGEQVQMAIFAWINPGEDSDGVRDIEPLRNAISEIVNALPSLTTTQSAPIDWRQGGLPALKEILRLISEQDPDRPHITLGSIYAVTSESIRKAQSAPSVGSVPTVEELENIAAQLSFMRVRKSEFAQVWMRTTIKAIHALLTSRTEGKSE